MESILCTRDRSGRVRRALCSGVSTVNVIAQTLPSMVPGEKSTTTEIAGSAQNVSIHRAAGVVPFGRGQTRDHILAKHVYILHARGVGVQDLEKIKLIM